MGKVGAESESTQTFGDTSPLLTGERFDGEDMLRT